MYPALQVGSQESRVKGENHLSPSTCWPHSFGCTFILEFHHWGPAKAEQMLIQTACCSETEFQTWQKRTFPETSFGQTWSKHWLCPRFLQELIHLCPPPAVLDFFFFVRKTERSNIIPHRTNSHFCPTHSTDRSSGGDINISFFSPLFVSTEPWVIHVIMPLHMAPKPSWSPQHQAFVCLPDPWIWGCVFLPHSKVQAVFLSCCKLNTPS